MFVESPQHSIPKLHRSGTAVARFSPMDENATNLPANEMCPIHARSFRSLLPELDPSLGGFVLQTLRSSGAHPLKTFGCLIQFPCSAIGTLCL